MNLTFLLHYNKSILSLNNNFIQYFRRKITYRKLCPKILILNFFGWNKCLFRLPLKFSWINISWYHIILYKIVKAFTHNIILRTISMFFSFCCYDLRYDIISGNLSDLISSSYFCWIVIMFYSISRTKGYLKCLINSSYWKLTTLIIGNGCPN